jgi:hypothetical protein
MVTDSEILLSINQILQNYEKKVVKAGLKVDKIRITSKQRAEDQSVISNQLKTKRIPFKNEVQKSESSFPVTIIELPKSKSILKLIYKKSSGGGSGAGAALTKLTESAQALYAALVFNVLKRPMTIKDVTKENFMAASSTAQIDAPIQSIMNDLPDDWINSSIAGANALYQKFKNSGKFTFHRGSNQVNTIESTFTKINREEKAFGNLNKWSPADIYMIDNGADVPALSKENTLKGLNSLMRKYANDNKVIGISLKKITGYGNLSKKNFNSDKKETTARFRGTTSTLESMDGYIKWGTGSSDRIQFRSFGGEASLTGWQGEIKGSAANQGKVSLGPINFVLKLHNLKQLPSSSESARLATQNSINHSKEIAELMAKTGIIQSSQIEETIPFIQSQSKKYRYSKYLVAKLFESLDSASSEVKDNFIQDLYLYASSQASYSAPYYKLE